MSLSVRFDASKTVERIDDFIKLNLVYFSSPCYIILVGIKIWKSMAVAKEGHQKNWKTLTQEQTRPGLQSGLNRARTLELLDDDNYDNEYS